MFLAAQLLSERVGHAIAHCFGEEHAEEAAFVTLVDQAFDTLNSRHPMDSKVHRSGFGMPHALDQQYSCLMGFTRLMRESRVVGRRCLLPFQQGFIMTSCALRGLYSAVTRPEVGMKYVLTSRLNQDCVENFFSQVHFLGLIFYQVPSLPLCSIWGCIVLHVPLPNVGVCSLSLSSLSLSLSLSPSPSLSLSLSLSLSERERERHL